MTGSTLVPVRGRRAATWFGRAATGCALVLLVTGCGGSDPAPQPPPRSAPELSAEIVQLRRDEALQRVEVGITNHAKVPVEIQTIDLRVPGYSGGGPQPKNEPLPPGQAVNLPTPYGEVTCPETGAVQVGEPTVVVQVRRASDPTSYTVELTPTDPGHCSWSPHDDEGRSAHPHTQTSRASAGNEVAGRNGTAMLGASGSQTMARGSPPRSGSRSR